MTKIFIGMSEDAANKPCPCIQDCCEQIARQYADISTPVELKPKTKIGKIKAECCGEPTVVCEEDICSNSCDVVITQKIIVTIPIKYEMSACVGTSTIECHGCG